MELRKVSIIIPAFNEEKNLNFVLQDIKKLKSLYQLQIIVVDDCSNDNTYKIAHKGGADLVTSHKRNMGKGFAFRTGLKAAVGDFIVQIDADGQLKASDIPKLITTLENGADVALGERYGLSNFMKSDFTSHFKMIGNLILSIISTVFIGKIIFDVMTGLKAFKRSKAMQIIPKANDFSYEAELVIRAANKGFQIKTIPISCRKRYSGQSNLRSIKHGFSVITTIIRASINN